MQFIHTRDIMYSEQTRTIRKQSKNITMQTTRKKSIIIDFNIFNLCPQ